MACLRQARAGFQAGPGGTEIVISVAERMVEEVDWPSYRVAMGPATTLGAALHALISSGNVDESSAAWNEIEEHVFSQGTIYSAAEPTVSVMLAALMDDQPSWRSGRILDLLFFIVRGVSVTDPSLQGRCRDRAREGLWLLARWALTHEGWARDNVLEVVEVIAPDRVELIRSAIAGR
ncbi:hypothetical protein GCM10022275_34710 [Tessaracoccus defluvii]